jgi:hypothetical protein
MSISILVKVKEFTEFWRDRLHELYEIEKNMPPLQGDELIPEIKREFCVAYFFIDQEEQKKDRFLADVMLTMINIPLDLKESYITLNAEIIQEWTRHIRCLRDLKYCVEADTVTFSDFEKVLDSAYDYFIDTYDGMSGALRCMKIDKSIREILSDEEAQKNHYLQSLEYRNRMIGMYKKGLEDIETYLYEHASDLEDIETYLKEDIETYLTYLNEHASEHDGYHQIRVDVSEIIRDVEKAVDKAGEL